MVKRRRERGYSLMEIVVTLVVFGMFIFIVVLLTAQMRAQEKKYPVNFMSHPDTSAVVARFRRDVYDSMQDELQSYPPGVNPPWFDAGKKVFIFLCQRINDKGESTGSETVVYDFRKKNEVHRFTFVAQTQTSEWIARGVPDFSRGDPEESMPDCCRIVATDEKGRTAIDQAFIRRTHH